ncbi:hypothetical protein [Cohnella thermotolerans]|uniref:hypothetical protein n=1 Tax=Cohnella thermotolerans TaxID=329858 RepID=UPI0004054856|nr:hypothetical protein [Cohnella thermotolerans]
MEKRLTRTDLMFALGFLFMLIVAVGAFFYGVKIGASQAEARQEKAAGSASAAAAETAAAYQLQDLVSFYHTVFLPYREFMDEWQSAGQKWLTDETADRSASLKELAKTANNKYESAKVSYIPPVSPLLKEAQDEYLKSLKLYASSLSSHAAAANQGTASTVLNQIYDDAFYKEGLKLGLSAQERYYESMVQWAAGVDMNIPSHSDYKTIVGLTQWKTLPLVIKNGLTAKYLQEQSIMSDFLPQDLTARIDTFIASGQAERMKLKSMSAIADLLTQTDAVRAGDFLNAKNRFYAKQLLPQLPFFSSDK